MMQASSGTCTNPARLVKPLTPTPPHPTPPHPTPPHLQCRQQDPTTLLVFADLLLGTLLPLLLVYAYELSVKQQHLAARGYRCCGVRLSWPVLSMALPLAFGGHLGGQQAGSHAGQVGGGGMGLRCCCSCWWGCVCCRRGRRSFQHYSICQVQQMPQVVCLARSSLSQQLVAGVSS